MLKKLQKKWGVSGSQFLLIFFTFALGGSACGFLGKQLLQWTGLPKNFGWYVLYIVLVSLLWPLCVIAISIPLGQYRFFRAYLQKLQKRIFGVSSHPGDHHRNIAIFASGAGSNARKIIEHFKENARFKVVLIVSNKPEAGVLAIAKQFGIPFVIVGPSLPLSSEAFLHMLQEKKIDLLVLAGFLRKIPDSLVKAFPRRIINIHPALLPAYGGKGMYGRYVHEAVISNKEPFSGISIHFVDEVYDHGEIILQEKCPVLETDNAESLADRIHELEHTYYPRTIEKVLEKQKRR